MNLSVHQAGAIIRLEAGRILVKLDGVVLSTSAARKVSSIDLGPNTHITTPALRLILGQGGNVTLHGAGGRILGQASAAPTLAIDRLRAQLEMGHDYRAGVAQAIVAARIRSMAHTLSRWPATHSARKDLQRRAGHAASQTEISRLLGIEGAATRDYYRALTLPLAPFGFTGRNRQPPKDPVNAAWSYASVILAHRVQHAITRAGLHASIGVIHGESRNNPALALDLMEEFRGPLVDAVAIASFEEQLLNPFEHFEDRRGGIYLNQSGRRLLHKHLLERYRSPLEIPIPGHRVDATWGDAIETQVGKFASSLLNQQPYQPLAWGESE
jgi:CRISP-associated protein Cas1